MRGARGAPQGGQTSVPSAWYGCVQESRAKSLVASVAYVGGQDSSNFGEANVADFGVYAVKGSQVSEDAHARERNFFWDRQQDLVFQTEG